MAEYVHLRIRRREGPDQPSRWEEFKVPYKPNMNVVSALLEIRKNPINIQGLKTSPVVWDCTCLEKCGACTMIINGVHARHAALIDQLKQPVNPGAIN